MYVPWDMMVYVTNVVLLAVPDAVQYTTEKYSKIQKNTVKYSKVQ